MTKPISPSEVGAYKAANFPPAVFEVFNALIAKNFSNGYADVKQKDVVAALFNKDFSREEIFENGYLNVEEVYREQGWKVSFDKAAYNESYDSYFTFKVK